MEDGEAGACWARMWMGSGEATKEDASIDIFLVYSVTLASAVDRSTVLAASVVSDPVRVKLFFIIGVIAEASEIPSLVLVASEFAVVAAPLSSYIVVKFVPIIPS